MHEYYENRYDYAILGWRALCFVSQLVLLFTFSIIYSEYNMISFIFDFPFIFIDFHFMYSFRMRMLLVTVFDYSLCILFELFLIQNISLSTSSLYLERKIL